MNKNWHTEEETGIVREQMDRYDILAKSRHSSLAVNFFSIASGFLGKSQQAPEGDPAEVPAFPHTDLLTR